MILKHLTPAEYGITKWSGGTTAQIAIHPAQAVYSERDFLWRVSSASVEQEASLFTSLPDYTRYISVLRGALRLRHDGGPTVEIQPYQVHTFDGGVQTDSAGRCTDFNLMVRKGSCRGTMKSVRLAAGEACGFVPDDADATMIFFCAEGSVLVSVGAERLALAVEESALLEKPAEETICLEARADSVLMVVQMQCGYLS